MQETVEWIVERERFEALAADWDALAREEPDPFLRHGWFAAWWDAHPGDDARVAVVWRDGELVAGLPLMVRGRVAEGFGEPLLVPFRPLACDDDALARLVAAVRALPVATVELHSALVGDERAEGLARGLRRGRPVLTRSHPDRFLSVETDGGWDAYRAATKSRWGSVERKRRKLAREHDARPVVLEPPLDVAALLDEGFALEARGWKGRAGSAVDDDAANAVFLRVAAHAYARSGELRCSEIRVGDRLVAWDLAVLACGRVWSLKTTYAEDLGTLSPGLVLRHAIVERCFALALDGHELLGHDMSWKRRFATSGRASNTLRVERAHPRPLARLAYQQLLRPLVARVHTQPRARANAAERWPPPPMRAPFH